LKKSCNFNLSVQLEQVTMSLTTEMREDTTLVTACLKGDPRAQKTLFEKFAPKMFAVCLRYMGDSDDAQDTLQDGFVKVFSKLADFKNEGVLEGWIRRIIVNTCLDAIRKNQKTKFDVSINDVEYQLEYNDNGLQSLELEELMNLVQSMPNGYRVVFNMFAIEGYTHKEIGDKLGINENTSKSQYLRARAFLRERIEKLEWKEKTL
jgi:RNA polymerase sigma factor (sigma-70 family)